ncbi:MAG: hypothetical protein ND866_22205 [Pyrinomonadaceae bacterium]|nr:hypothetical protein [Pyrinomonadaceae bacterium]
MTNRRTLSFSIFAVAMLALCLPAVAVAQWNRYPDNQGNRDRDYGRNGRYDDRYLRDSVHRLDRLAKNFEREVDRSLDRSRRDGTRSEDRINAEVRQFRNAVSDLKSRVGNGRDLNRSRDEAQRVLQEARQLDRIGNRSDYRVSSLWSQIRQELNVIAQAYGSYGYNDDYRNGRNRTNNNDWWRRLPVPY